MYDNFDVVKVILNVNISIQVRLFFEKSTIPLFKSIFLSINKHKMLLFQITLIKYKLF
jgi:hypothetical protein